jgi:hypothetical protein
MTTGHTCPFQRQRIWDRLPDGPVTEAAMAVTASS